jgi:hypothetical protein
MRGVQKKNERSLLVLAVFSLLFQGIYFAVIPVAFSIFV